jgi:hypothetical protein
LRRSSGGRRLVEDQDAALGGDGAGDEHQLALTAAECREVALGQGPEADPVERGVGQLVVAAAGGCERAQVPGAAHQHHVEHPVGEGRLVALRDEADRPGPRWAR